SVSVNRAIAARVLAKMRNPKAHRPRRPPSGLPDELPDELAAQLTKRRSHHARTSHPRDRQLTPRGTDDRRAATGPVTAHTGRRGLARCCVGATATAPSTRLRGLADTHAPGGGSAPLATGRGERR